MLFTWLVQKTVALHSQELGCQSHLPSTADRYGSSNGAVELSSSAEFMADTSSDSETDEVQEYSPDFPVLAREIAMIVFATLGLLLVVAGLGFWTVHPPGESQLCQTEVLGLQNATLAQQRSSIAACHSLYSLVFAALGRDAHLDRHVVIRMDYS
eukprot:Skav235168  [mRNA]  locus=scaffold721:148621:149756:- [translate_table: standard]